MHDGKRHHAARRPCPVSVEIFAPRRKSRQTQAWVLEIMFSSSNACIGAGKSFRFLICALWPFCAFLGLFPLIGFCHSNVQACIMSAPYYMPYLATVEPFILQKSFDKHFIISSALHGVFRDLSDEAVAG